MTALKPQKILDSSNRNTSLENEVLFYQNLINYIINHNNTGIAVHDLHMNYLYVSKKYAEQYRIQEENLIGKNHYDLFPDLPQKWKDVHQRVLKGEIISADKDPYPRSDGHIDWTRWECRPWYHIDGNIGGIIVYTEVINDEIENESLIKEKTNQLLLQKNKIETTLHSIGDGVISMDLKGTIEFVNEVAAMLIGYKAEQLKGLKFSDTCILLDEYSMKRVDDFIQQVIIQQKRIEPNNHTMLISADDQKYYVEISASPIKNQNGEVVGVVLIVRDITEKRHKEKQIEYLVTHDPLTELYNRRYLTEEITRMDNQYHYPLGFLMIDINGLKIINEAYGYNSGDTIFKKLAKMLRAICSNHGVVGRIGGDEFGVLLKNTNMNELENLKKTIIQASENIHVHNIVPSLSIGIAIRSSSSKNIAEFINEAENDMYKNKFLNGMSVRNDTIKAILKTLTDKYLDERVHLQRVSRLCKEFALILHFSNDEVNELEMAGMFHDIGKISIPDAILDKPGKLTEQEFAVIKSHTEVGYQILRAADRYSSLAEGALSHHERWDGKGYPNGLKEEQIPKIARIIGIVDSYEAMTSNRVYRKRMKNEEAIAELRRCSGTQFDAKLVEIFITQVLPKEVEEVSE